MLMIASSACSISMRFWFSSGTRSCLKKRTHQAQKEVKNAAMALAYIAFHHVQGPEQHGDTPVLW